MKKIVTLLAMLLLITTTVTFVPVRASPGTITVGIIGPQGLPHFSPCGMWQGAELAASEINATGGVDVGGTPYYIKIVPGNEYAVTGPGGTPEPDKAVQEVVNLITLKGCQILIGGFRTECAGPMINKSMDYKVPFFIDGASTDDLISKTVRVNYDRFKYTFRVTPINSTMLFYTICAFLGGYVIPTVLKPIYGHYLWPEANRTQVRVAVLTEALNWTLSMHAALTNPAIYPKLLGPYANVTFSARVDPTKPELLPGLMDNVIASQARLMIHVFSAPIGVSLIVTWASKGVQALPVGINVMGQLQTHWATTGGLCQYECILATAGTRTPIVPGKTEVFWDHFTGNYSGKWPLYTAWGAYDSIYGLKEAIEAADSLDPDTLVPVFEATDRTGLTGRFRYANDHDVYMTAADLGPYHTGNVRAMMVQWQAARMEVVWPIYQYSPLPYARMVRLPTAMYPLITDINYDGRVDGKDIAIASKAFGSYPGHPRWRMEADLPPVDGRVDGKDIAKIAKDFGKYVTLPLP